MKSKIKMGIDLLMTALLLGLMVYQITGQALQDDNGQIDVQLEETDAGEKAMVVISNG